MKKLNVLVVATWVVALHAGGCALLDPDVGAGSQAQAITCLPSNPDALVFQKAVCVCEEMNKRGSGVTAESYSSFGTNAAAEHRGDVGINGSLDTTGNFRVDGALDVAGSIAGRGYLGVATDLAVGGDLVERGHVNVLGNAQVGGDLMSHGYLGVDGSLRVGGELAQWGQLACSDVQTGVPFALEDPCPCDPASLIDVAAEVSAHAAATPLGLVDDRGHRELHLTAGDYYDEGGAALRGATRVTVEGAVRVFIDGDLDLRGSSFVALAEGAELDLYISGSLHKVGNLVIGAEGDAPASRAIRIFVAGDQTIELVGHSIFEGSIYAPQADIDFRGNFQVQGALFARNLVGRGHMLVRFDAGLIGIGEQCVDEVPPDAAGSVPGDDGAEDDKPVCSEEHPELCPGGVYEGEDPAADAQPGDDANDGDPAGSDPASASDPGAGQVGDGSSGADDPASGDPASGDPASGDPAADDGAEQGSDEVADSGEQVPVCSEENMEACQ